jgi:hypothetical protein
LKSVYTIYIRLDVKEEKKLGAKKDAAGTAKIYKEMRICLRKQSRTCVARKKSLKLVQNVFSGALKKVFSYFI